MHKAGRREPELVTSMETDRVSNQSIHINEIRNIYMPNTWKKKATNKNMNKIFVVCASSNIIIDKSVMIKTNCSENNAAIILSLKATLFYIGIRKRSCSYGLDIILW